MLTLAETDIVRPLILIGIVIGILVVATVIITVVRKKILSTDQTPATGLIMDDFRRLHASGQLSDAEFQALRTRMAAKMKQSVPTKGSLHDESAVRAKPTQVQRPQRPARPPASPAPPAPPTIPPTE